MIDSRIRFDEEAGMVYQMERRSWKRSAEIVVTSVAVCALAAFCGSRLLNCDDSSKEFHLLLYEVTDAFSNATLFCYYDSF
ncbi:MAG: hypothetical protein ACOYK9_01875 [Chlamydiia bacterium]